MGGCVCKDQSTSLQSVYDTQVYELTAASHNCSTCSLQMMYLSASPFFLHLNESQLRSFASKFVITAYPAGSVIVKKGEQVDRFYVIGNGAQNGG